MTTEQTTKQTTEQTMTEQTVTDVSTTVVESKEVTEKKVINLTTFRMLFVLKSALVAFQTSEHTYEELLKDKKLLKDKFAPMCEKVFVELTEEYNVEKEKKLALREEKKQLLATRPKKLTVKTDTKYFTLFTKEEVEDFCKKQNILLPEKYSKTTLLKYATKEMVYSNEPVNCDVASEAELLKKSMNELKTFFFNHDFTPPKVRSKKNMVKALLEYRQKLEYKKDEEETTDESVEEAVSEWETVDDTETVDMVLDEEYDQETKEEELEKQMMLEVSEFKDLCNKTERKKWLKSKTGKNVIGASNIVKAVTTYLSEKYGDHFDEKLLEEDDE